MTPRQVERFGLRSFTAALRLFGVPATLGWDGSVAAKIRVLSSAISRRQTFSAGVGLQGEHDADVRWLRADPATGKPHPAPAEGMLLTLHGKTPADPTQTYRVGEVVDNPAAPFWQVGLTAV